MAIIFRLALIKLSSTDREKSPGKDISRFLFGKICSPKSSSLDWRIAFGVDR
jgi:hypothetical protein